MSTPLSKRISILSDGLSSDVRQASQTARSMGFGGILFNVQTPQLSIPELSQTGRREFRHTLAAQELKLVGLAASLGPDGLGPKADVDRVIDHLDRAMRAAVDLAAPLLCLDLGPLAEPAREAKPRPKITPEQAGLIILPAEEPAVEPSPASQAPVDQTLLTAVNTAMLELCNRAERYGCTIALRSSLASFAAIEHVIAAARCPWLGVDLDPVEMLADAWDIDEIFSRLGALIRHVRARDALSGTDHRTRPVVIGNGNVDWPSLLWHLDQSGYHSWLTIYPMELTDRLAAAREGLQKLTDSFRQ